MKKIGIAVSVEASNGGSQTRYLDLEQDVSAGRMQSFLECVVDDAFGAQGFLVRVYGVPAKKALALSLAVQALVRAGDVPSAKWVAWNTGMSPDREGADRFVETQKSLVER